MLERLMAAVRPEFRSRLLVFDADDTVFGGGACRVEQCRRPARGRGMCPGHLQRWVKEGRPDLEVFVAVTDPGWQRQRPNAQCRVPGCGYGSCRAGMCVLHGQQWRRAGGPDPDGWLPDRPIKQPAGGLTCRIDHCTLWPHASLPFCHSHAQTWKVHGRPDIDQFESVMERENRQRGFFVSFGYSSDAERECTAFHKRTGRIIKLLSVQEILDEEHVQKM